MSHKQIASVAEPWFLLPLLYFKKSDGIICEFSQEVSQVAINDFINNLPNKETDYLDALRCFTSTLYEMQCNNNEMYFLDKTPRYYFIIPEISKVFPDAKFIFLFRNPVHIMSSIIQTWGNGNLQNLYKYERDLNFGPKALSDGYELLKDKAFAIKYEECVTNPNKYIRDICTYLEIEFDNSMLNEFACQNMKGRMGDSTGVVEYNNISLKSLEKWKDVFNSPFRKKMIYKYIDNIENKTLSIQGYTKKDILNEILNNKIVNKNTIRDRFDCIFSSIIQKFNIMNHYIAIKKLESIYRKILKLFSLI